MTEKLKKIPGFSVGVRENSAVRRMVLAAPVCPYSRVEMERTTDGRYVVKDRGPSQVNCQRAGGKWWLDCESRGHDPYFSTRVWYTTEDVLDENSVVTGVKKIRHEEKLLNTVSVPLGRRFHSGRGVINSIEKKGRRRLSELGYQEVCQFRNCQNPVSANAKSQAFGEFCSSRHLQLVAADAQGIFLVQFTGRTEMGSEERIQQEREKQLREAAAFAKD